MHFFPPFIRSFSLSSALLHRHSSSSSLKVWLFFNEAQHSLPVQWKLLTELIPPGRIPEPRTCSLLFCFGCSSSTEISNRGCGLAWFQALSTWNPCRRVSILVLIRVWSLVFILFIAFSGGLRMCRCYFVEDCVHVRLKHLLLEETIA